MRRAASAWMCWKRVRYLRAQGYEVILADITQSPLPEKFDVVIGGEVLEHLTHQECS